MPWNYLRGGHGFEGLGLGRGFGVMEHDTA